MGAGMAWNEFDLPDGNIETVLEFGVGEWAAVRGPMTAYEMIEDAGKGVRSRLGRGRSSSDQ